MPAASASQASSQLEGSGLSDSSIAIIVGVALGAAALCLLPLLHLSFCRARSQERPPIKGSTQIKPPQLPSSTPQPRPVSQSPISSPITASPELSFHFNSLPFETAASQTQTESRAFPRASPTSDQGTPPPLTQQDKRSLRVELQIKREKEKESEDRFALQMVSDSELEYESSDEAVPPEHTGSAMVAYTRVLAEKGRLRRFRAEELERRRDIRILLEDSLQDDDDDELEVIVLDVVRPLTLSSERAVLQRTTPTALLHTSIDMTQSFSAGSISSFLRMVGNTSGNLTATDTSVSFDTWPHR